MKLDPKDTYLLLIDLQDNSLPEAEWPVQDYPQILGRAAATLDAARDAGLGVLHVALEFATGAYDRVPGEPPVQAPRSASELSDPISAPVAPRDDETVILKAYRSAFFGTDLHERLQRLGCRKLVIVGVWTDACIFFTVLEAIRLGYQVVLVEDALGSATRAMHQVAIVNLANRLYRGAITSSSAAIQAFGHPGKDLVAWEIDRPVPFQYSLGGIQDAYNEIISAGQID
jgi:maleamate amidohydrolase